MRLYVAGDSPNSLTALTNVHGALQEHPGHHVTLEVIDVLQEPEKGIRDGVVATPLLIRLEPPPERRVLGNLQDRGKLLGVLGLKSAPGE
jgi:circadian clock protein KaiB